MVRGLLHGLGYVRDQLGLTNAVPAKASYVTDGSTRTLKIDGRTVRFRHAGPSVMQWAGKPAAPVAQALPMAWPRQGHRPPGHFDSEAASPGRCEL